MDWLYKPWQRPYTTITLCLMLLSGCGGTENPRAVEIENQIKPYQQSSAGDDLSGTWLAFSIGSGTWDDGPNSTLEGGTYSKEIWHYMTISDDSTTVTTHGCDRVSYDAMNDGELEYTRVGDSLEGDNFTISILSNTQLKATRDIKELDDSGTRETWWYKISDQDSPIGEIALNGGSLESFDCLLILDRTAKFTLGRYAGESERELDFIAEMNDQVVGTAEQSWEKQTGSDTWEIRWGDVSVDQFYQGLSESVQTINLDISGVMNHPVAIEYTDGSTDEISFTIQQ